MNPCLLSSIAIVSFAVVAFLVAIGYFTRAAYYNGFAAGFDAARDRFKRIVNAANARDIFKAFENEIDADGRK